MKNVKWFISLLLITTGCSQPGSDRPADFTTTIVEESDMIIDAEKDTTIIFSSFIRTASDYFLVYDGSLKRSLSSAMRERSYSLLEAKEEDPVNFCR